MLCVPKPSCTKTTNGREWNDEEQDDRDERENKRPALHVTERKETDKPPEQNDQEPEQTNEIDIKRN